jgi:electron transfer flavoprotein alpha subunit
LESEDERRKIGMMSKKEIFVFVEQTDGTIEHVSLEVLGKAREIADKLSGSVTAVILGEQVQDLARDVSKRGADLVVAGESPLLKDYTTEAYSKVVESVIRERDPDTLLIGATHNGASLAASLAIKMGAGLMAHVIDLEVEEGTGALLGSVPGFGGSIVSVCKCGKGRPQMATVRPGIFKPIEPRAQSGIILPVQVNLSPADKKCNVLERNVKRTKELSRAERVVIAGLGCRGDFNLPKKLAEEINAELGVSRPVADRGLYDKEHVVGSTGQSLNAKIAIVLGVSGAAHFTSGIRDVKTVIAINTDPKSQIFKQADYCVNGDVFQILPHLTAELEKS